MTNEEAIARLRACDDLLKAFVAGACFGILFGIFFMALVRSFFW